ncbi:hypothetical protein HGM15179_008866 [Zosterops borbonicus]|uniref:Uncharacterized protein n=1 Tax=Zosterops borbonicus TaxID=364589 RepID=A0A8K1LL39_9PASS|nr:hypothetical protein HGM15179_008866 [Zosterops borbonicus]
MARKKNHFATTRRAESEVAKIYSICSLGLRQDDSMQCKVTPKDVEDKWFKNKRKVLNANLLTPELNGKGIKENILNGFGSLCHKK